MGVNNAVYGRVPALQNVCSGGYSDMVNAERSAKSGWTQGGCQTWYVTKDGINTNNWPGPWLEYKRRTLRVNPDEYQFI